MGEYKGNGIIVFKPHSSTRTKLHEIAHKTLGHELGKMKTWEFVDRELNAEAWAWRRMDKKLNYRIAIPAFADLIDNHGYKPQQALLLVLDGLERQGIKVGKKDIKALEKLESEGTMNRYEELE